MAFNPLTAPWHNETFNRFITEQLPELIARRIPLEEYSMIPESDFLCRIEIAVTDSSESGSGTIRLTIPDVPCPDEKGIFRIDGNPIVVVPIASSEDLEKADIKCVGELLFDFIEPRIGEAPSELQWNEQLVRSWLPIDKWMTEFLTYSGDFRNIPHITSQRMDTMNWISQHEHLRRLLVLSHKRVITRSHQGRVCPVQSPEGPNIGRVLPIARGAVIQNRKLEILDDSPDAALSITASMIPCLEFDEPARALMGANMMRQWQAVENPEPALVTTGFEPDEPGFWNGRNLLTVFMSLGESTFFDGIVISESAAKRLNWEGVIEPGDKISNRHGTKGVISRILPDAEMPHLPDGTPVELVFSFIGQQTRMNFGQLKEALLGRIARTAGQPLQAPPFNCMSDEEIRQQFRNNGWDESGMELMRDGKDGPELKNPCTVGFVYWGVTIHLSRRKVFARPKGYQRQGQAEFFQLRNIGAYDVI